MNMPNQIELGFLDIPYLVLRPLDLGCLLGCLQPESSESQ